MSWAKLTQEDLSKHLTKYMLLWDDDTTTKKKIEKHQKQTVTAIRKQMNDSPSKLIMIHLALYLTGTVNSEGRVVKAVYTPCHRAFLCNFLRCLFPHIIALKIIQMLEQ